VETGISVGAITAPVLETEEMKNNSIAF